MGPSRAKTLSEILDRGSNNFDLLRLFAAVAVIFGHSFYVFPTGGFQEPVTTVIDRNFTGTLAVGMFFFLSGILVTHSFARSKSPVHFVLMRSARIFPAGMACVLIVSLVVGPFVSSAPALEYLQDARTYCYLRDNLLLAPSLLPWNASCQQLPGLFSNNRYAGSVNGSLWTLAPEIACYLYVLFFGMIGALRTSVRIALAVAALLLLHAINSNLTPYFSDSHYSDTLKVALFFLAGVLAYAFRLIIVLRWTYLLPLVLAAMILRRTEMQEYALYIALFYLTLLLGASQTMLKVRLPGDYSFGVYIYGWPIQQLVAHIWPSITSYPSNLVCVPVALVAGYASWNLIERRVLKLARALAANIETRPDVEQVHRTTY